MPASTADDPASAAAPAAAAPVAAAPAATAVVDGAPAAAEQLQLEQPAAPRPPGLDALERKLAFFSAKAAQGHAVELAVHRDVRHAARRATRRAAHCIARRVAHRTSTAQSSICFLPAHRLPVTALKVAPSRHLTLAHPLYLPSACPPYARCEPRRARTMPPSPSLGSDENPTPVERGH